MYEQTNSSLPMSERIAAFRSRNQQTKISPRIAAFKKRKEAQSNAEVFGKSVASGVTSIADLPQQVGSLMEKYGYDPEFSGYGTPTFPKGEAISSLPLASSKIKEGIQNLTGYDITPRPSNELQRILAHGGNFVSSMVPFLGWTKSAQGVKGVLPIIKEGIKKPVSSTLKLASKTAKSPLGVAGAMGVTSGALQEGGVDPLIADLSVGIGTPLLGASKRSFFDKFSNARIKGDAENNVAKALISQIGEKNVPEVLNRIKNYRFQKKPIDVNLTTPEIVQNPGLSMLSRSQTNFPELAKVYEKNNEALVEGLNQIGTTGLPENIKGELVRTPFVNKYNKSLKRRATTTESLYEELEKLQTGIKPAAAKSLLENNLAVSGPIQKPILERFYNSLNRNDANPAILKQINRLENDIKNLDVEFAGSSPEALRQLKTPLVAELDQLKSSVYPRPLQLEKTIQELGNKITESTRMGNENVAREYNVIKKAYEEDLSKTPVGLKHRQEYARLSKPINELETSNLLYNFINKNTDVKKRAGFVVSSEKIPALILNADLTDTKTLVNKAKGDKETLGLVKGTYIEKLLEISRNADGLSYPKANNFINNKYNKEKLKVVFNKQERKKIDQYLDVLKRRSNVSNVGRGVGSDTAQKLTIDGQFKEALNDMISIVGDKTLKASSSLGVTGKVASYPIKALKNYQQNLYNVAIENALKDPQYFNDIISNPYKSKAFNDFYYPVPGLGAALLNNREE